MELDVTDTPASERIEALKATGPLDDAEADAEANGQAEAGRREQEELDLPSKKEVDEAVGKVWGVGWNILARRLDAEELEENEQDIKAAEKALGPLVRKYLRSTIVQYGTEGAALVFLADAADRKYRAYRRAVAQSDEEE